MMRRHALAAVAALTTLALLGGAAAATASWNATASISGTASSTTISTALAQSGTLNTSYRYSGNSATAVTGTLTITNTGGASLTYSLANRVVGSSALAQKTALQLWTGSCGTVPAASAGVTSTNLANTAPMLPESARTLGPGQKIDVCVATRISGSDASSSNATLQGQTVSAEFSVTGAVGTNWRTTGTTAAITQSVYRIGSVPKPVCAAASSRSVTLTWNAPTNRVANAPVTYRIFDTASNADVASVTSSATTASVTIDASRFASGRHPLAVEAKDDLSGSTSLPSSPTTVVRGSVLLFFPTLDCA